jgi:hypothetical protein
MSGPTEAQIRAGAHVLSENYNDHAPIGEERYGPVAVAVYKAMLRAATPAEDVETLLTMRGLFGRAAEMLRESGDPVDHRDAAALQKLADAILPAHRDDGGPR